MRFHSSVVRGLCVAAVAIFLVSVLPAFAQVAMPDPKEMAGIPRPVTDLPDGAISVRLIRGQLSNNIVSHPIDLRIGDKVQTVRTDENGRAQFEGVPPGTTVSAAAVVDGERLVSQPFPVPLRGGIRLMLVATAREGAPPAAAPRFDPAQGRPAQPGLVVLGSNTRMVVELSDDGPQVFYLFEILNNTTSPVDPTKPFEVELPSGATNATLMQGSSPQALLKDTRLTVTGPFASGRTMVQVAFILAARGTLRISQPLPAPLEQLSVIVRKLDAVEVTSPQLTSRREVSSDGQIYIMATGPPVAAGTPIAFDVTGLPHHGRAPRYIALAFAIVIVIAGVWASVAPREASAAAARRQHLHARREKLFTDLVRIEQQRRDGRLDAGPYADRRRTLVTQLERVYGELDQRPGARGGSEGLAA